MIDLQNTFFVRAKGQTIVISFFSTQVGLAGVGAPQEMVVLVEMPSEEQVAAKEGCVLGEVTNRDVEKTTLLQGSL